MAIVEASRSPALVTVYRSISDLLKRSHVQRRAETSDAPGITDYLVEAHREVFLSILARDPDKADGCCASISPSATSFGAKAT